MLALAIAALLVTGLAVVVMVGGCIIYRIQCGMNLQALGSAMIAYAHYNEDEYPTVGRWCDSLVEAKLITEKSFSCPANREGKSHYAMNPNAEPNSPPDTVLLFETKGGWNQFGGPEILTTENHMTEGSNILFNDGSVRFIKTEYLPKLRWEIRDANSGGEDFSE